MYLRQKKIVFKTNNFFKIVLYLLFQYHQFSVFVVAVVAAGNTANVAVHNSTFLLPVLSVSLYPRLLSLSQFPEH